MMRRRKLEVRMRPLVEGSLTIDTDEGGAVLVLCWSGVSSDAHPERILLPYLEEASTEADRRRVALELHCERREYCSSATLAVLVEFIQRRARAGQKLACIFDVTRRWQ